MPDWSKLESCCGCLRLDLATRLIGTFGLLSTLGRWSQHPASAGGVSRVMALRRNISNTPTASLVPLSLQFFSSIFICKQRFLLGLFIFYLVKLEDVRDFILDDLYGKYPVEV